MCSNVPPIGPRGDGLHRPVVPAGSPEEIQRARVAANLGIQPEQVTPYDKHPDYSPEDEQAAQKADELFEVVDRIWSDLAVAPVPVVVPVGEPGESVVLTEDVPAHVPAYRREMDDTGLFRPVAPRRGKFLPMPTATIEPGTDQLKVGKHRTGPQGKVYRSKAARPRWYRRRVLGIPVVAIIAAILIPAVAFAAWVLTTSKEIKGTIRSGSAETGWAWVPVADNVPMENNGGVSCRVAITNPDTLNQTFTMMVSSAIPGGKCKGVVGLQVSTSLVGGDVSKVKRVMIGEPVSSLPDVFNVSFDNSYSPGSTARLFTGPTNPVPLLYPGQTTDNRTLGSTYGLPLIFEVPEGAEINGQMPFTITLPLTICANLTGECNDAS